MATSFETVVAQSTESVTRRWNHKPRFGIVLGTGAGVVAQHIEPDVSIPYSDIRHFPVSTAIGHQGNLVCGSLGGHQVVAMQGRFHLYEGYCRSIATLPIHVMRALGVEVLFVSNAAGGLNPNFASGELMLIDSHVDLMNRNSPLMLGTAQFTRPIRRSDQAYCPRLMELSHSIARRSGFAMQQGVYAAMLGPNYETRAEYRFLRRIGADAAGMSTVPEVNAASACGMKVLAISIITNIANPDSLDPTSGEEVIDAAATAAPNFALLVRKVIETLASPGR